MTAAGRSVLASRWFVPAIVVLVTWSLTTHGKYSVSGDEPHYLMVAQSLWTDGDLDVRNNHAAGESRLYGVDGLEPGLHVRETRHGALFPVHDVGFPAVLLPLYGAATTLSTFASEPILARFRMGRGLFAYSLISLVLIVVAAGAAALTRSALIAEGATPGIAASVVLALWLAPPVLSNSFLVFPEVIALLVAAWAVRMASRPNPTKTEWTLFLLAIGMLPWLHRKFVVCGALLLIAVLWQHRYRVIGVPRSWLVVGMACVAVPHAALGAWTLYHWGNVGGALMLDRLPFSWSAFQTGVAGLLIDRENGLFVWAPIYLLVPAAWALVDRRHLAWAPAIAAVFFLSAAHDQWWGGFSPAARFLVPIAPLVAVQALGALRHRPFRWAAVALLVPTLIVSAYGWQNPRALWPRGDGEKRVLTALLPADVQRWLPSLRSDAR